MATSPYEMFGGHVMPKKTGSECAVPGCWDTAVLWPYEKAPNVRFCTKHATKVIRETIRKIDSLPEEELF